MRRLLSLAALLLLTACSGTTHASPAPSPKPVDAYTSLAPPAGQTVGSFASLQVGRALEQAHGLLAEQLLEPRTVTGLERRTLTVDLTGAARDVGVARDLGVPAVKRGLLYRPLFPAPLQLADPLATVVRSNYVTEQVRGLAGETGLRVRWSGVLRYDVRTPDGTHHKVSYTLKVGYVFSAVTNEPSGILLQQVQTAGSHAAPVLATCLAKGLLWPAPSASRVTGPCPA